MGIGITESVIVSQSFQYIYYQIKHNHITTNVFCYSSNQHTKTIRRVYATS